MARPLAVIGLWLSLLLSAALLLASVIASSEASDSVTVQTNSGPVVGAESNGYRSWLGIPYAAAPVNSLRWQPPQPPKSWASPRLAVQYAPMCPQDCVLPPGFCGTEQSEDCLHLNVWTPLPSASQTKPWPVMVFFAGGAYFQGDGGVPIYAGNKFVNISEVVLVTCSYRLGALGFLVTDDLNGFYGIQDQRQVLKWVATNIGNFGGDASNITVFGESAGAMSIAVHLTSPLSAGLFHRAIMESNPFALEYRTKDEAKSVGDSLASYLGCGTGRNLTCLMSRSANEIVAAQGKVFVLPPVFHINLAFLLQWTPVIDGVELTQQPIDAMIAGKFHKMPIMLGSNANEGVLFVYQSISTPVSVLEYTAAVTLGFREDAAFVLEHYPVSLFSNDTRQELAALLTQYLFNCATRRVAQAIAAANVPVFLYFYDHKLSFGKRGYGPDYQFCVDYVCHGSELPLVFDSAVAAGFNFTSPENALSEAMVAMWSNFAKTGNPSSPSKKTTTGMPVPYWPTFNTQTWADMWLTTPPKAQFTLLQEECAFWDWMGYNW